MRKARPKAVLTVAIINLVMGGLMTFCGVCWTAGTAMHTRLAQVNTAGGNPYAEEVAYVNRECPAYRMIQVTRAVLFLVFGVLLLTSGIGLLSLQNWARWLAIAVAPFLIVLEVAHFAYQFTAIAPVVEQYQRRNGKPTPPGDESERGVGSRVGITAPHLIVFVPVVAVAGTDLGVLLLPTVGAAFAPKRRRREYDEDDYDADEGAFTDRPRPRRRRGSAES
jgi:hypothetical protein